MNNFTFFYATTIVDEKQNKLLFMELHDCLQNETKQTIVYEMKRNETKLLLTKN